MDNDIFYPNDIKYNNEVNMLNFIIYPVDFLYYYRKAIREINKDVPVFFYDYDNIYGNF